MTKIDVLGPKGHETVLLPPEEAKKLIEGYGERYFVVDKTSREVLKEIRLEDDQEIALIPKARGG